MVIDVIIIGDAISEFGTKIGNLVSCKGRLEIKAIDRKSNKILSVCREVKTGVDLSEVIAGKHALQKAAKEASLKIIPQLVENWNRSNK